MRQNPNNKLKKALLELLLEETFPWVTVDTDYPGVDVPEMLHGNFTNFKMLFENGPQIPDLKLTDEGWTATLSFGSVKYFATIPWEACVQFGDGEEGNYSVMFKREEPAPIVAKPTGEKPARKFGLVQGDKK